jgi:hypothetical protein
MIAKVNMASPFQPMSGIPSSGFIFSGMASFMVPKAMNANPGRRLMIHPITTIHVGVYTVGGGSGGFGAAVGFNP